MRRKGFGLLLLVFLAACHNESNIPFDQAKWLKGDPTLRHRMVHDIYERNLIDSTMTRDEVIELLGEPEYDLLAYETRRYIGYDILRSHDSYRGYHWFDIYYDTITLMVTDVSTRDD